TALVEMVVRAGDEAGCAGLDELSLMQPLVIPPSSAVTVQVTVGAPDTEGRRPVSIHSRPQDADTTIPWTRNAQGLLAERAVDAVETDWARAWPPVAAETLPVDGFYDDLAEAGYGYGPAFQGLKAAWREGDTVFAEVQLPDVVREEAAAYALHPVLLDVALQTVGLVMDVGGDTTGVRLPFIWSDVSFHASGASALRVRLARTGPETVTFAVTDPAGRTVASVGSLVLRQAVTGAPRPTRDGLHEVVWNQLLDIPAAAPTAGYAVVGTVGEMVGAYLDPDTEVYPDFAALYAAPGETSATVIAVIDTTEDVNGGAGVRVALERVLGWVRGWLAGDRFVGSRLVVVTCGAVAVGVGEVLRDAAGAAVWGLVKSAESENPGRFLLVDVDGSAESWRALSLVEVLGGDEPQFALRGGQVFVPRLVRAGEDAVLLLPPTTTDAWRLETGETGSLDGLRLAPAADAEAVLLPGQVRIAVRAAGLNFRDVLGALGMYPGGLDLLGSEIAGEVLETGEEVSGLAVGDRVMGLVPGGFGPVVVADRWRVVRMPSGWAFAQAAGVPVAFLTALYGLRELGGLAAGQRVLIHAAAGGVGMAAVQLARLYGAEVYATASAPKQGYVRGLGVAPERIASSRSLDFAGVFPRVDVVLNSLAGEYV
ncbi:polyketide synthase dehydratase domain-containing protein, partial [Streptomyces sp. NPDC088554]|uniref:polyketide synthase dehydratase domain-containing protein n=1 Tax=Streptomyces sp. NPDC088554 TaxID=3365865 RepID=UPI003829AB32